MAGSGCQQRPIDQSKLRPGDLPAQNLQLVAQDEQLDVFHMQTATTTNQRPKQSPHGEIEKREGHASILAAFAASRGDTNFGALQLMAASCERSKKRWPHSSFWQTNHGIRTRASPRAPPALR
jgi:hypothetical protein